MLPSIEEQRSSGRQTVTALPLLAAAFAAGIALARIWPHPLIWSAGLTFSHAVFLVYLYVRQRPLGAFVLPLFLLLGVLSFQLAEREIYAPLRELLGRQVILSGYVHRIDSRDSQSVAFLFKVEEAALVGEDASTLGTMIRVRIFRLPPTLTISYGQRLRLSGELVAPAGQRTPGGFNYAAFLAGEGVAALLTTDGSAVELLPGRGGYFWLSAAAAARQRVEEALLRWLPPQEAGLALGLLLGETEHLAVETEEAYRRLGITHLLSVSGLHTAFVAAFALLLTRRIRRKAVGAVLAAALVLAYLLLTGGEPPVWRAAIMLWLVMGARQLGRESDGVLALAAAALLMLFFRPHWLFNLSFQFSFLASLGILLLSPRLLPYFSRLPRFLNGPISVTIGAQAAVLPLQLTLFALLPLFSVPANLLFVPLVGAVMGLGLAVIGASIFSPLLAAPFCYAIYPVLLALNEGPKLLAALPGAAVVPPPLHPGIWGLYVLLLCLFVCGVKIAWSRARLALTALLLLNMYVSFPLITGLLPSIASRQLEVVFLDVGQGLSVFIRTPEGKNILLDAGGRRGGTFDPGERIVLPYLRNRRVTSLDLLVLTHPSEDHHGGIPAILSGIAVRRFASNGERDDTASFLAVKDKLAAAPIPVMVLAGGDRLLLGEDVVLEVLSPPPEKFSYTVDDVNNNALIKRLIFSEFSILFTSDGEHEALERLVRLQPENLSAAVLQVPHHGSRRAMSEAFLAAVGAQVAVISVGRNTYGHPHEDALMLLQQKKMTIYRTDLHGAVSVRSDGFGWTIDSQLSNKILDLQYR
ncbi:MAG: DNA internalization-related competence protein ComEC/Rec2 [Dethiobacter sp.]|jgi:competence protein ComEC|nr:DNA internalization-related competence protein ComEC/Rec2 [Dethiobacter sp.]MBS3901504.1 DNA internalization-related competence protein ComEC/Rec2 [Dethiobacter sp.]